MKKILLSGWIVLILAGGASFSSDPQAQYDSIAAQAKNISAADVIRIALGCRYYQTDVNISGIKTEKPLKFSSVLAMEFSKAKKADKNASLSCKRDKNTISYAVSVSGREDRGFAFEYENFRLNLTGIVKGDKTRKCLIPLQCTAAFLSELALNGE